MSAWSVAAASYSLSPITTLQFDFLQELLWSGNSQGYVSSWFTTDDSTSSTLNRYTSYKAHNLSQTHQILSNDRGILSLGMDSVKLANRRGLCQWQYQERNIALSNMAHSPIKNSEVVVAASSTNSLLSSSLAHRHELLLLNVATGTLLKRTGITSPTSHIRTSKNLLCCAQLDGTIVLREPREYRISRTLPAHTGGISALEVGENTLYSLGYTIRQGVPIIDPHVKIYDIRAMKALAPVPTSISPSFLKVHPKKSNNIYLAATDGRWKYIDVDNQGDFEFNHVEVNSYLTAFDISPTGDYLAFADAEGTITLWCHPESGPNSSLYVSEIVLPTPPEPIHKIAWDDATPLSSIPMPEARGPLLSEFAPQHLKTKYSFRAAPKIDPEILANAKTVDGVRYATLPKRQIRNQVPPLEASRTGSERKLAVPLFRSEKEKERQRDKESHDRKRKDLKGKGKMKTGDEEDATEADLTRTSIPPYYGKVEIKYSKFGIEDFDFGFYNKTKLSGLETHVVNSYVNPILQVLRFIPPFRQVAASHIAESCAKNGCLLCELGFLFKMLRDAKGQNCQASNFCRAFTADLKAGAFGLLDIDEGASSNVPYSSLIQLFNRYVVETTSVECDIPKPGKYCLNRSMVHMQTLPSVIKQLFEMTAQTTEICQTCGNKAFRDSSSLVTDLVYPRKASTTAYNPLSNEPPPATDFPSILQRSINRESVGNTTCVNCRRQSHQQSKRTVSSSLLPPVLSINSGVQAPEQLEVWLDSPSKGRFLQPRIEFYRLGESIAVRNAAQTASNTVYELRASIILYLGDLLLKLSQALVFQVQTEEDPAHLVAAIKVPANSDSGIKKDAWYLFNDFLVRQISEEEALSFSGTWKIPSTLYFTRVDCDNLLDFSTLPMKIEPSILFHEHSVNRPRDPKLHRVLQPNELPQKGTIVALDAEFVSLQQEEVDYFSDGRKLVLRPARMSLARVSVLRGDGPLKGTPFIDDYIETTEDIVDYLTEYSGIRAGDLDRHLSRKSLVSIKTAYKKLRLLLDLGCIFIGHGLSKDFRIINIFVPPDQIVDTVNIYHLPHRQRRISLRFLAWYMLDQTIQSEGIHDSIEDARTALKLYEHYQNAIKMNDEESSWEEIMEGIYNEGKRLVCSASFCEPFQLGS
ncbi:hypothetical protein BT69DRAFT_1239751 [Atractiella rhizophila]|nr:hypothetical protein BT69DRAFT_1239751 [Atractiella rhizophila]